MALAASVGLAARIAPRRETIGKRRRSMGCKNRFTKETGVLYHICVLALCYMRHYARSPSCPALCRASTSLRHRKKDVDGRAFAAPKRLRPRRRVKPGHDEWRE